MVTPWRVVLLCAVGAGTLVSAYVLWLAPADESAPDAAASPAPCPSVEHVARELRELAATVATLRRAIAERAVREPEPAVARSNPGRSIPDPTSVSTTTEQAAAEEPAPPAAGRVPAPIRPEDMFQETLAFEQRLVDAYDAHLAQEPRDSNWAWTMEKGLAESLRLPSMGQPRVLRLDCGSTMCGLRLAFRDVEARQGFDQAMRNAAPWTEIGGGFVRLQGLDDLEIEVYVARQGHMFPPSVPPEAEEETP